MKIPVGAGVGSDRAQIEKCDQRRWTCRDGPKSRWKQRGLCFGVGRWRSKSV